VDFLLLGVPDGNKMIFIVFLILIFLHFHIFHVLHFIESLATFHGVSCKIMCQTFDSNKLELATSGSPEGKKLLDLLLLKVNHKLGGHVNIVKPSFYKQFNVTRTMMIGLCNFYPNQFDRSKRSFMSVDC